MPVTGHHESVSLTQSRCKKVAGRCASEGWNGNIPRPPGISGRSARWSARSLAPAIFCVIAAGLLGALPADAADPENCLLCHRYRGLARVDLNRDEVRLFYIDPTYYDRELGPHARLKCTDCHPREEVEVIPHQPVSPVDCTRTCHLTDRRGMEVRFSHENPAAMLESSVHALDQLDVCNQLLGSPLEEGQARCLLCHDEPVFRWPRTAWLTQVAPVARCLVCHDEQLPLNAPLAYWHVHARSRPARNHREMTRACALCHSDPAVRQAFHLTDTASSYLFSFHGKAAMLGSEETAGCLDCHVAPTENVHLIQSHRNPESPTHPANLADTCRSPACHPTAGHRVSTAAVHLDLGAGQGAEYFIAALFVVLILITFGPSLVLESLELLQVVVRRQDPTHHHYADLARRILATPGGRAALKRFTPHQRVQHWVLVVCFVALVLTGFPIKFADRAWAQMLVNFMGGLPVARFIHRYAGLVLMLGLIYHLAYVGIHMARQRRATGKGWLSLFLELPMVVRPADLRKLFQLIAYLLFLRKTRPRGDRFSFEQKFEYFGVFWGTVILGITGTLMWANAWTTEHLTGRVLTIAMIIHTFEAFLALLHVGVLHMVAVIFSPAVLPMSPAMFTGDTPVEELAETHAAMIEEAARKLNILPAGGSSHE